MSEIEKITAERNLFKGKYRALLKLVNRTRDKLVHVTDHIEDEGDRQYFGSTNDADALRDLYHEMMSWIWDSEDETNRMKSDPYADIREQRARADKAEVALAAKDAEIARLEDELYEARNAPWPAWADSILKTLKKFGYDPNDGSGEVDLGEAFKDYLDGVGHEDEAQRKRIAELQSENAEWKRLYGASHGTIFRLKQVIFGRQPHA